MFRHNLLIIYRNFKKFKTTFFINIVGLSTGLGCTLLIFLWVNDELSINKFHEKDKQLYQVMENQHLEGGIKTTDGTAGVLAESIAKDMPEVEYAATVTPTSWFPKVTLSDKEKDKSIRAGGQFVSPDFFNIFSYPLVQGNKTDALADKKSIVISVDLAKKLFNTTDNVVGRTISWKYQDLDEEYKVSGIFKSNPASSSQFDFLLPFVWLKEKYPFLAEWGNYGPNTFVVLKKGVSVDQLNKKLAGYMNNKITESNRSLFLTRYSDTYLHNKYENGVRVGGRIQYVRLFSIIAIFILLIACINFMNLSTAKASTKLKEVGLKKTLGASRYSLILQYFSESILLAFISLIFSVILVLIFLPQFNQITGKHIALGFDKNLILIFLGITLFTGLVAGSYPALYLSGFSPVVVLKGMFKGSLSELWIRKGLVVFQFAISIVLIVCVLITYRQIEFIQTQNPGYEKDNIIYFEKEGKIAQNPETFISELKNIPGVLNASAIAQSINSTDLANTMGVEWPGKQPNQKVQFYNLDVYYDLIETLGIKTSEGRTFSRNFGSDDSKIIFNEAAIKTMGLKDPIGKVVKLWGKDMQIIGVVKDFHFESLHEFVKPLLIRLAPENLVEIMVKISRDKQKETINRLQKYYERFNPGFIFDFKFLDADYQALYVSEKQVAVLSRYFAGMAIIISCLGLFGLAAFTAERRFKEIGIRKTLGSSNFNIIYLLSRDFTMMVLLSNIIALPISFLITRRWLNTFEYRIQLQLWYFLAAGFVVLFITWITVGIQASKAARINPIQSLRANN
jgi:putative ABC transport system permease protein